MDRTQPEKSKSLDCQLYCSWLEFLEIRIGIFRGYKISYFGLLETIITLFEIKVFPSLMFDLNNKDDSLSLSPLSTL